MLDQKQSNNISKVIGIFFIGFGFVMLCIGFPFITIDNRDSFENTIMALFIISGVLMLVGGYQNIKKAKQKDVAIKLYEEQIKQQLKAIQNVTNPGLASINESLDTGSSDNYKPDIIATWNYTQEEWKLMTEEETRRRWKEGIWVSLGIGLLGGLVLSIGKGVTFLTGAFFSLCLGIFISWLKVVLSNNLLLIRKNNSIIITTNALIINGKFKTIQDMDMHLEYVKNLKIKEANFLEFSLQWKTRNGVTNDQFRIYVPPQYENEIPNILGYYSRKGVEISYE